MSVKSPTVNASGKRSKPSLNIIHSLTRPAVRTWSTVTRLRTHNSTVPRTELLILFLILTFRYHVKTFLFSGLMTSWRFNASYKYSVYMFAYFSIGMTVSWAVYNWSLIIWVRTMRPRSSVERQTSPVTAKLPPPSSLTVCHSNCLIASDVNKD